MTALYRYCLLGENIGYSQSPSIFKAIFRVSGHNGQFDMYDMPQHELADKFRQLTSTGLTGLSVTIPYKKSVITLLDKLDPISQSLEAVNSISITQGKTHGYNTDCYGFGLPLRKHASSLKYGTAVIIGCGGAAKAVLYTLYVDYEIREFCIIGRSMDRLEDFRASFGSVARKANISVKEVRHFPIVELPACTIVVNCTPIGGPNHSNGGLFAPSFAWNKCRIYYDLNYNADNSSIALGKSSGLVTINGSAMLVGQAIRSFELWTGIAVPFEPIYASVFRHETKSS